MKDGKNIERMIDDFVSGERNLEPNPFLSTRIMASLDQSKGHEAFSFNPLRKLAFAVSMVIAVFIGVATGNQYKTGNSGADVILINDDKMERFDMYNFKDNE
jgi:hypothetical protein